jgi:hypothetical protein
VIEVGSVFSVVPLRTLHNRQRDWAGGCFCLEVIVSMACRLPPGHSSAHPPVAKEPGGFFFFFEIGFYCLPSLALTRNPPDLCLLSS